MQGALTRFVAIGQMSTSGAGTVVVIAVMGQYEGHRQVVGIDDALSGVGDIFTGSEHERVSWKRRFGRIVYSLSHMTLHFFYDLIVLGLYSSGSSISSCQYRS